MRPLRSGQDAVLSWRTGAMECCVVAAAGDYVLLRPERRLDPVSAPRGAASLTYLDGLVPVGWDGEVEAGGTPGELRFHVTAPGRCADRRTAVRVPVHAAVRVTTSAGDVRAGEMLDVSAGGMRFRHAGRFRVGDRLRVLSVLPAGLVVDADAVVRAAEPGVTSVAFTQMHGADGATVGRWTVGLLRSSLVGHG